MHGFASGGTGNRTAPRVPIFYYRIAEQTAYRSVYSSNLHRIACTALSGHARPAVVKGKITRFHRLEPVEIRCLFKAIQRVGKPVIFLRLFLVSFLKPSRAVAVKIANLRAHIYFLPEKSDPGAHDRFIRSIRHGGYSRRVLIPIRCIRVGTFLRQQMCCVFI